MSHLFSPSQTPLKLLRRSEVLCLVRLLSFFVASPPLRPNVCSNFPILICRLEILYRRSQVPIPRRVELALDIQYESHTAYFFFFASNEFDFSLKTCVAFWGANEEDHRSIAHSYSFHDRPDPSLGLQIIGIE